MPAPYYQDEWATLYLGDCLVLADLWTCADVLVTDPPYGIGWTQNGISLTSRANRAAGNYDGKQRVQHGGISNDEDTSARDAALTLWGGGPAVVFGALRVKPPSGTRHIAVYQKPVDSGVQAALGGIRRDIEAIYMLGHHPEWRRGSAPKFRSSVFTTNSRVMGTPVGITTRAGHPHAKPVDVLEALMEHCPPGTVADPFAGSGSTLVAAKASGRRSIGVELEEKYCEIAARRLSQDMLDFGTETSA